MTGSYVYLISTLPTLHFGLSPAFSFEKFIAYCQRFISEAEIEILKRASISGDYDIETCHPMLKKWQEFDTTLRNELVKIRASRKHVEPEKYLRQDRESAQFISHIAISAHRNPALLEAEKIIDQERWRYLDELCFGHYFDLDFLIIYCLKLLILERWERVNTPDKAQALEEALKQD
jgi:hypothetical protein